MTNFASHNTKLVVGLGAVVGVIGVAAFVYKRRKQKKKNALINEIRKPWVHIKNLAHVEEIIATLIKGGKDKLQIIADFDRTLTPHEYKGKLVPSAYGILDNSPLLPPFFKEQATQIRNTYYPLEISHELTMAEKYPIMVEWWTKAHDLMLKCNITKSTIQQAVAQSDTVLRDGCDWMFCQLNKRQVPLLIFSAGVGDVIEEIIRQKSHLYDNMKIVSNYMDFNSQGHLVGFQGELIHVFNKNEHAIHKSDYFEKISHRTNAILLGDSMGDLHMADGAAHLDSVLKIGFLNDKVEQLLPTYLEAWDIVIVKDHTMDVCNALLKEIL